MSADTIMAHLRPRKSTGAKLVNTTVAFALGATITPQFALQAWLSYRFARDVWGVPQLLCVGVIFALDLFVSLFMIFTYLLRTAHVRTKIYVWAVLFVGIGAQLFAAEQYAAHEGWPLLVEVFAGLPALFLAASLHGTIIWRRHTTTTPSEPTPVTPALATAEAAPPDQDPIAVATVQAAQLAVGRGHRPQLSLVPKSPQRQQRPAAPADERQALAIKRVVDGGESARAVALDMYGPKGVKNVQNWAKAERARREATSHSVSADPPVKIEEISEPSAALSDAPVPKVDGPRSW
jgi:hypothetical protein